MRALPKTPLNGRGVGRISPRSRRDIILCQGLPGQHFAAFVLQFVHPSALLVPRSLNCTCHRRARRPLANSCLNRRVSCKTPDCWSSHNLRRPPFLSAPELYPHHKAAPVSLRPGPTKCYHPWVNQGKPGAPCALRQPPCHSHFW